MFFPCIGSGWLFVKVKISKDIHHQSYDNLDNVGKQTKKFGNLAVEIKISTPVIPNLLV